jgi:predicted dehydrogenase
MKSIKIAILGFGKIAEDQHVPSIEGNKCFELVATSSRTGHGVGQKFSDWRELLRSVDGLEAVAITTPPEPRFDIARECVAAGLHCLLEKPPTAGLAQIAELDCLAQAENVTLFTTWHAQHNPAVDEAARLLAGKRIKRMAVRWHENVHKWHPGQNWIFEAGGFGVFDPGINAFSVITKIFPGAVFVRSAELQVPENAQTPIAAKLELGSPAADGPLSVSFDFRWSDEEEWTIEIATTDGIDLRLEKGGAKLFVGGAERPSEGPGEYPDIYRLFADLIDERRSLVDVAPFRLVADSLLVGSTTKVKPITM